MVLLLHKYILLVFQRCFSGVPAGTVKKQTHSTECLSKCPLLQLLLKSQHPRERALLTAHGIPGVDSDGPQECLVGVADSVGAGEARAEQGAQQSQHQQHDDGNVQAPAPGAAQGVCD